MSQDAPGKIKIVAKVSTPPELSPDDIARIDDESRRLYDACKAGAATMEHLTADDLKIRCR